MKPLTVIAAAVFVVASAPVFGQGSPAPQGVILEQILVKINGEILTKTDLEQLQITALREANRQVNSPGDLTTDATTYETDPEWIRGHDVYPSITGWRYGSIRDEDQDDWLYIPAGGLWGLKLITSSFSSTTIHTVCRVIELL